MSATGTPSAPCRRINAFCASENFEAFIAFRSSQPGENTAENSSSKRPNFRGADHFKDGQMKRARFTEDQIIGVLKEHEAGAKTADLARKHCVSEATLYNWKAKYGGMDVTEAKRLKQLEDENAKLKKLLAEQMLDAAALRELLSKKW